MTDRFDRAKSRLLSHEQAKQSKRILKKRLGTVPADETVKIPKIGEWNLSETPNHEIAPPHRPSTATPRRARGFPQDIPLSATQRTRQENPVCDLLPPSTSTPKSPTKPVFKLRPPRPITESPRAPSPRKNFPSGTLTTDLDSIIKSKHRQAAKPIPPIPRETTKEDPVFMPLEVFDDATFEEYPIEELMKTPVAYSKYQDLNGNFYWAKCNVLEHDKETGLFLIEWANSKKRKKVARFNLKFDRENEIKFQARIDAATKSCRRYETQVRFNTRVSQLPTESLPELANDDVDDIINLISLKLPNKYEKIRDSLLDEVKANFKYMNNQLDFIYDLRLNPLMPDRDAFLNLLPEEEPVPESGLVDHEPINFPLILKNISTNLLFANGNILHGLMTIWGIFQDSKRLVFLTSGYDEVLPLDEFVTKQYQQLSSTTKLFKGSMQETLEGVIGATMNDEMGYNRQKEKAKYSKMIVLSTRMLHTILLQIVENTVDQHMSLYKKFIENETPRKPTPQFSIDFVFQDEKELQFVPSIETFRDQLLSLLVQLETSIHDLPAVNLPMFDIDPDTVSFADCVDCVKDTRANLEKTLEQLFDELRKFLEGFKHLEPTLSLSPENFVTEFDPKGERSLADYRNQLSDFSRAADCVQNEMKTMYNIGLFKVSCEAFKENAARQTKSLIFALLTHMKQFAICDLQQLQEEFTNINNRLKIVPETPEQLALLKEFMDHVLETTKERSKKMDSVMQHFAFLEEFKFEITNDECQEKYKTLQMPRKLSLLIDETDRMMQVERIRMIRELRQNQRQLETETMELTEMLPSFINKYQDLEMTIEAVDQAKEIQQKLKQLKERQDKYNSHERLFNFEQGSCRILTKLMEEFSPLNMLWMLAGDWLQNNTTWLDQPFTSVKPDVMNSFITQSGKKISRLRKDLMEHPTLVGKVLNPLNEQIDAFKTNLPLISKLRHPGIKTQHWEKISKIVGFQVNPSVTEVNLQGFIDLHLERWSDQISEIAGIAAQEYNIEASLDQMDTELQQLMMQTNEFRDTKQYILTGIDDLISIIDDQLVTTQTLLTSPYIAPVKKRALEHLQFLRHSHDTMDAWVECQRGWLYLQPIFTGTSIQQKLHREARDWNFVDKTWGTIMQSTHQYPSFLDVLHRNNLYENLTECNKYLDSITQGLNAYLESKRLGFPRFFFLSNDELIAILSHTKDFNVVMKSLNKLFEYIQTMSYDDANMITHMNDDGLETVKFSTPVDGNTVEIEDWLNAFEEEMRTTIRDQIRESLPAYQKKKKEDWLASFPAQVVLIVNQIIWTQQVTNVLHGQKLRSLKVLQTKFIEGLEGLTSMIRKPLSPAIRQVVSCLLILEVHNRDIIVGLVRDEVSDVESFKWVQQLRYYWEDDTVMVRSINNAYEYSYEYAGNSARLVITPLTDRCYQTLLAAFKQNLSGAPSGPAGTGKTETARDCAKALGRACVVYNCSEEVTPEQMSQFFSGLSSSGSWCCFDEFNRINIEVLSVIAQQVRTIQDAISANADTFVLDARTLKLNVNAAIIITMNPGYAGRTELPDNLKALFRPCAMMVPDFGFIAEIMLFSGGYAEATSLSIKLVSLFDLCRKQLSKANHYDWGLRAMKAILSTAGKQKRAHLEEREALLLVQCIIDCTRPRLVSNDIPLFDGIIHDVFPDVTTSKEIPEDITKYLQEAYKKQGMQPLPIYINKCNEILETTVVRHGLMFVGGAMGGKTVAWKALQDALTCRAQETNQGMGVGVCTLNPKSISIPELYGLFDPVTSGWSDGVLSSHIRDCSTSDPTEFKWIIVDGPVDSLWIETMNSLLDDNKVLCLSNNERISLGNHVRLMFEVDDLSQASPATVSRCGMIYFDPSTLPWEAISDSWMQKMPEEHAELGKFVRGLLDKYVPQLIQFAEVDAKIMIGHNPIFFLNNALRIVDCFIDILRKPEHKPAAEGEDAKDIDPLDSKPYYSLFYNSGGDILPYFKDQEQKEAAYERIFIFAIIWAFGGVCNDDSRQLFDKVLREMMTKNDAKCQFPASNTVFDYYPDLSKQSWIAWTDGTTGVNITANKQIEQQLVPTNESAAMMYISRLLVMHEKHCLFHGPESSKTLVINTLTNNVLDSSYDCKTLPFAYCSTAMNVLTVLRSYLHKRHGVFGPLTNHHLVVYMDNINSVKPEVYGAQPPLELVRQLFDMGGWYDTSHVEWQKVVGTTVISSMGPSGGGLFSIPDRLLRHFYFMHCPKLKKVSLQQIVQTLTSSKLSKFPSAVQDLSKQTVEACLSFYELCQKSMLPIPSKLHYIFSLRNIVRVIKGITLAQPKDISSDSLFIKLWYHEMQREFFDRFNTHEDRKWFHKTMADLVSKHFRLTWSTACPSQEPIFNDFADRSQTYKEVTLPQEEILKVCNEMLQDHNRDATKQLDIVLFREAVDHLSSLCRVLKMRRGHAMLVGVKSSGRKSLARLAMHISQIEIFEIQITRTYSFTEWREDMKNLMRQCGQDLPTALMISDVQIIGNFQLEDISNLLINGEIPNLFERDELEQIKADIASNEMIFDQDPGEIFFNRVKKHLHIILVFSPFGNIFKDSMLSFPALRTETMIDWYMPWSDNALENVGKALLQKAKLSDDISVESVVSVCVKIHKSVEDEAQRFFQETKRFTACTPSRYFELLATFNRRLCSQQEETTINIQKYSNGVDKINATRAQIEELSQKLDRDIPMLTAKSQEVAEMLKNLQVKQGEVEQTRAEVKAQSEIAEVEAAEAAEINKVAQEKLAEAQPILIAAQNAVDSMDKDSLVNIKQLKKIHPALRETFEAICIIFGKSPRKVDTGVPGVKEDDYWPETLGLINDAQFIKKVKGFEVENLPRSTIDKLKKYVGENADAREKKLQAVKGGYQAVANLYLWVCASYDYWFTYQEILPKKLEAEEAAKKLAASEAVLAARRAHLKSVEEQLAELQAQVDEEKKNEEKLAANVADTKLRLDRAQKIMSGLSGETKRWGECAETLKGSSQYLLGDSLLVSGCLTHLGAFSPPFRTRLIDKWKSFLVNEGIRHTTSFQISASLGNETTIREWIVKGLPNDTHSVENALIIETSKQAYPLLIDPQLSGTKWLRAEVGEKLAVLRFDQSDFIQRMRSCVAFGVPVLIENVGLKMDPLIDPILSCEFLMVDGMKKVSIGGEYVNYSDDFRLFLSTKYPNPQYSPEICSQVTLINFTTTQEGLSDLLMNNLIEVEQEELDRKRIAIMEANAENMKKLKQVEEDILQIVSNAGADLLEDNAAIDTLNRAQKTSADIAQQVAASQATEKQIATFRATFSSVSDRAALLYFCASDFAVVDPMYQFSLKWFVQIFKLAIHQAEHPKDTNKLIETLNLAVARQFYQSVSFSLFSRHKLLFSTLMASRICIAEKRITGPELAFLLQPNPVKEPHTISWIPEDIWPLICALPSVSDAFKNIIPSIKANEAKWKTYLMSNEAESDPIPLDEPLTDFQKLIILRVWHLHRVREGLRIFVSSALGPEFVTPPPLNLGQVFKDSNPLTPLIFIITAGIDPEDEILGVATAMENEKYLKSYSLGRGRGQGAEELILDAADRGFWVLLQNCHLSLSWMPRLEHIIDNLDPTKVHTRFRLCLVTMSSPEFPIGILYQGTKLIYEIPKGIRENMMRIYSGFNNDEYDNDCQLVEKQLTFHLSFFHSIVLERLQFGSIGWNIPYEFNPSDFAISRKHLRMFLGESPPGEVPFESLTYVIGELNYGGRVTDRWDRRLLLSLLQKYFSEDINNPHFSFGQKYKAPAFDAPLKTVEELLMTWPIVTAGEDVGLSMNASTITARNDALGIFNSLIEIQPTLIAASGAVSEEEFALTFVEQLLSQIPQKFNVHNFVTKFDITDTINTVVHHEILLYNKLIDTIQKSLLTLQKGLKGMIVIDAELDTLNRRILANKIPEMWLRKSFPSILTLRAYMDDLNMRVAFINQWVTTDRPKVFKIGAFFHPEEFLTAVLQVYARKHTVPFDTLVWRTKVTDFTNHEKVDKEPDDGIYAEGIYVEGAKWDVMSKTLTECGQRELISTMPIIHMYPSEKKMTLQELAAVYECPMYRTQNRGTGALDLPNYLMSIYVPSPNQTPDHWIQRSVATFVTVQV
ncbi:Dynein heavy chain family protein [Tritrichomonas foetus]|uniref:Dynein-1, subspecies f n=1 Tax=Tritrichomonas foetus TaxID=1144522 RepID=A0A1J4K111_9EUKA|nr:Dynein heavy chain family protein [Tritrichomonas foetus]|eukprot:OHT05113.1 Dynein heavy chain family protein [Tritrichomonas foetus]